MKNSKKGFTIVELVIVIAVIAILAAVLIPTFSGVIQKANQSSALQEATSVMKTTLAMSDYGTIEAGTIFVIDSYDANGYQFKYNNNKIEAVEFNASLVTYNVTGNTNRMNAIIISKDNLNSVADNAIIKAALGTGFTYSSASSSMNYVGTFNKGGTPEVKYAAGDEVYFATAPSGSVTEGNLGTDFFAESGDGHTVKHTVTENDTAILNTVKTPAVSGTTWYVFTNTDYANDVVTFTYSKIA